MRRKILVLGGTGTLGKTLKKKKFFNKHFFPSSKKLDITNVNQLEKFIKNKKINLIINCAAIARMSVCERYKNKSFKVNVLGVQNLKTVINKIDDRDIKLIHISSDDVYPSKVGNYAENSKLKPYNYYGKTKLFSEKIVKKLKNFVIIRTRFFNKKKIKFSTAADDSFTSSIEVNKLVFYIILLIKKNFRGIINVGGDKISDYDLYKKYKKIMLCKQNDIQKELKFKISKNSSMNIEKLKKIIHKYEF